MTVSISRKKLSSKVGGFQLEENPFLAAGMKDLFKNAFLLDGKTFSSAGFSKNIREKWFLRARKDVPTNRNEEFVEKCVSTILKDCLFWQESFSFKIGFP